MNARPRHLAAALAILYCVGLVHEIGTAGQIKPAEVKEQPAATGEDGEVVQTLAVGRPGFRADVKPFLAKYCVKCHGAEKNKGDIAVDSLEGDLSLGQDLDEWESI